MTAKLGGDRLLRALQDRLSDDSVPPFELTLPDGSRHRFGSGQVAFAVHVRDRKGLRALLTLDEMAVGEAYVHGHLDLEGDALRAFDLRRHLRDRRPFRKAWRFVRQLAWGRDRLDREFIPRHYDRGNDLYFSFLDRRHRLYSQAVFHSEDECLEQAAENKLAYIHDACGLGPGTHVLDVGAGWGSFAAYASARGTDVTMLTISHAQYEYLSDFCWQTESPGRRRVELESVYTYDPGEQFDAAVILGVMEHLPDYEALFSRLARLLRPHGRLYMDFSATRKKYDSSTFTYEHIFEGNHSLVLMPDLLSAANGSPFELTAAHNDRHSYFLTIRAWAENLDAARDEIVARFGEETYRVFRLYLWGTAHGLHRWGRMESYRLVFQKSQGLSSDGLGLPPARG